MNSKLSTSTTRKRKPSPIRLPSSPFSSDTDEDGFIHCTFCQLRCKNYEALGQHIQQVHFNPLTRLQFPKSTTTISTPTQNHILAIVPIPIISIPESGPVPEPEEIPPFEELQILQNDPGPAPQLFASGTEIIGYKCSVCNEEFEDDTLCMKHFRNTHEIKPKSFQCIDCKQVFKSAAVLEVHNKLCLKKKKSKKKKVKEVTPTEAPDPPAPEPELLETKDVVVDPDPVEQFIIPDNFNQSDSDDRETVEQFITPDNQNQNQSGSEDADPSSRSETYDYESCKSYTPGSDQTSGESDYESIGPGSVSSSSKSYKPSEGDDSESQPSPRPPTPDPIIKSEKEKKGTPGTPKISSFPCLTPGCGKIFTGKHLLLRHITTIHDANKFQCPKCPKHVFKTEELLKKHLALHEKAKKCPYCNERPIRLAHHLLKTHDSHTKKQNEKILGIESTDFKCRYCYIEFSSLHNLDEHIQLVHKKNGEPWKASSRRKQSPLCSYVCSTCKKDFVFLISLRKHYITHSIPTYNSTRSN